MYCDQCGARMPEGAAVCPRCSTSPPTTAPSTAGTPTKRALLIGAQRNLLGNTAGLIAAWFNLPLAIFMMSFGAALGALGGLVSGTIAGPGVLGQFNNILAWVLPLPISMMDLLPTAAVQIGGTIGAVYGAGLMASLMLFGPWSTLWEIDPTWPFALVLGQLVTAFVIAAGYVAYCAVAEPARLRVSGIRRPSRREAEWLMPLVEEAATRLGVARTPMLLIDDSREPNAYAGIRHIVINRGLLDYLSYDRHAIAGIIAHEVAHYKHGDATAMAWSRGIAWPVFLVYELTYRLQTAAVRWSFFIVLVRILLWSVLVTIRFIVVPLNSRHWRRCEYRADAEAMEAGYGPGLHSALSQLGRGFDGARTGWDAAILATHPHTELRMERLETVGVTSALPTHPLTPWSMSARPGLDKD